VDLPVHACFFPFPNRFRHPAEDKTFPLPMPPLTCQLAISAERTLTRSIDSNNPFTPNSCIFFVSLQKANPERPPPRANPPHSTSWNETHWFFLFRLSARQVA
jgi:hypothetical protein